MSPQGYGSITPRVTGVMPRVPERHPRVPECHSRETVHHPQGVRGVTARVTGRHAYSVRGVTPGRQGRHLQGDGTSCPECQECHPQGDGASRPECQVLLRGTVRSVQTPVHTSSWSVLYCTTATNPPPSQHRRHYHAVRYRHTYTCTYTQIGDRTFRPTLTGKHTDAYRSNAIEC